MNFTFLTRSVAGLSLMCLVGSCALAGNVSPSLPTDRGRVVVRQIADPLGGPQLKVLRTDANSPLRAGTAWIWSKQFKEEPPKYHAQMRGKGLNAARIILFDTWEHEAGYGGGDWNDATYRAEMLARIERAVNYASAQGMYAVINSHNKISLYDEAYNNALWEHVAPYFAGRTHVLYEASNEALEGTGIGASGRFEGSTARLLALRNTFNRIRELAPNTHLMVLTPAGVSGWGFVDGLARLTEAFKACSGPAIDWTKTSVAYHLYHGDEGLFPLAENLRAFHARYPGWPSENNFPSTLTNEQLGITDSWRSVQFGSDVFVTQTCERLGLGWSHWNIDRSERLERNFKFIEEDAKAKGYWWEPDPITTCARFIDAGGPRGSIFSADTGYFGGSTAHGNAQGSVDTSGVVRPAPVETYRNERYGELIYQFARLPANRWVVLRLHFTESYSGISAPGQRLFDVTANRIKLLSRFDILAAAGRHYKAVVREFRVPVDTLGRLTVEFRSVVQNAKVDALEVFVPTFIGLPPMVPPLRPGMGRPGASFGTLSPSGLEFGSVVGRVAGFPRQIVENLPAKTLIGKLGNLTTCHAKVRPC